MWKKKNYYLEKWRGLLSMELPRLVSVLLVFVLKRCEWCFVCYWRHYTRHSNWEQHNYLLQDCPFYQHIWVVPKSQWCQCIIPLCCRHPLHWVRCCQVGLTCFTTFNISENYLLMGFLLVRLCQYGLLVHNCFNPVPLCQFTRCSLAVLLETVWFIHWLI